jgi:MYXO-CTERM domain-containing protein
MEPVVRVYDATGTTELLQFDLGSSPNPDSGAISEIPASSLDDAGHVITVEHADDTAETGTYAASIGPSLASDNPPAGLGDDGDEPSGGALGPWGLLIAALMALVGLRQRRATV